MTTEPIRQGKMNVQELSQKRDSEVCLEADKTQKSLNEKKSTYNYDHKVETCPCGTCYKARMDFKKNTCDDCGIIITGTSWNRPCGNTCYPCGKHHDFNTCPECKDE